MFFFLLFMNPYNRRINVLQDFFKYLIFSLSISTIYTYMYARAVTVFSSARSGTCFLSYELQNTPYIVKRKSWLIKNVE